MEYLGLFILFGFLCFLFYLAFKEERKINAAKIAREKAQTELLEAIVSFIQHKHICICWDAIRESEPEVTRDV